MRAAQPVQMIDGGVVRCPPDARRDAPPTYGLTETPEQHFAMTLKDLHRLAIERGDDAASRALGHAEAQLSRNPGNRQALMYKGSLLTMVGEAVLSADKRRAYIRNGVALMDSAMAGIEDHPSIAWEMAYVRATSLAILPEDMGLDAMALAALRELVHAPDFDRQEPFEKLRALTLLACTAQQFGQPYEARSRFLEARAIDEERAVKTYTDWLNRSVPDPDDR